MASSFHQVNAADRGCGEFNALLRLEANYRRGGLTAWERTHLDRRFDRLSASIREQRRDRDRDNRRHLSRIG